MLQRGSDREFLLCQATNTGTPGFAVCSLRDGTHDVHQLRCADTGALLGEWSDADKTFRQPINETHRTVEFSGSPFHWIVYGDVA
ncbi:hypothetical protein ACG96_23050 [Rhodococcoides fascians]|nr:hypothetical protein ACG96_23050 [Rhodococcus fascians]